MVKEEIGKWVKRYNIFAPHRALETMIFKGYSIHKMIVDSQTAKA
jgi:hypothetical protein